MVNQCEPCDKPKKETILIRLLIILHSSNPGCVGIHQLHPIGLNGPPWFTAGWTAAGISLDAGRAEAPEIDAVVPQTPTLEDPDCHQSDAIPGDSGWKHSLGKLLP